MRYLSYHFTGCGHEVFFCFLVPEDADTTLIRLGMPMRMEFPVNITEAIWDVNQRPCAWVCWSDDDGQTWFPEDEEECKIYSDDISTLVEWAFEGGY